MLMLAYYRCLEGLFGAYRGASEGALRCMVIVVLSKHFRRGFHLIQAYRSQQQLLLC